MKTKLRPPAIPLVTVDPYFSVWSMADRLTDDVTRHWTGAPNSMAGFVRVDGRPWRFLGLEFNDKRAPFNEIPALPQTGLDITATSTVAHFACDEIALDVTFTSPLLPDDLKLMSRPVSYVSFSVRSADGGPHAVSVYFDATHELCVNDPSADTAAAEPCACGSLNGARVGRENREGMLAVSGDELRIDWGWLYVLPLGAGAASSAGNAYLRRVFIDTGRLDMEETVWGSVRPADERQPLAAAKFELTAGAEPQSASLLLAYEDFYSIEYFGEYKKAYCFKDGETFESAVAQASSEYPALARRCAHFDAALKAEAEKSGGPEYAEILALAYRQAVAAHKLIADGDGHAVFLSKECYSNGCIGTVDVSYPSIPLFLRYNPELVRAMMRPIFRYAASPAWPFDFAPHDVGQYPKANGQVYGRSEEGLALQWQMPVEECGNMLVMMAAACAADGDYLFARENIEMLGQWVEYLKKFGQDPGNQLCTDDFAGHLEHNTNLSVKAIVGIGAYARILERLGLPGASETMALARGMAAKWVETAADGPCFRLTFDEAGTWSMKYNLLFDRLLGLNLFPEEAVNMELASYPARFNRYGLALDNRATYTKADWILWCAALAPDHDAARAFLLPLWRYYNETGSRVPLTDWYDTVTGRYLHFRNRSVIGGLFALLLKDYWNK